MHTNSSHVDIYTMSDCPSNGGRVDVGVCKDFLKFRRWKSCKEFGWALQQSYLAGNGNVFFLPEVLVMTSLAMRESFCNSFQNFHISRIYQHVKRQPISQDCNNVHVSNICQQCRMSTNSNMSTIFRTWRLPTIHSNFSDAFVGG